MPFAFRKGSRAALKGAPRKQGEAAREPKVVAKEHERAGREQGGSRGMHRGSIEEA